MVNHDIACEACDLDWIACRVDAACTLLTKHPDLATAITLIGLPRCSETLAVVQRAQRIWPIEIAWHPQPNRPHAIDVAISGWPVLAFSPARPPHGQRSLADQIWAWVRHTLRRPAHHLEGFAR